MMMHQIVLCTFRDVGSSIYFHKCWCSPLVSVLVLECWSFMLENIMNSNYIRDRLLSLCCTLTPHARTHKIVMLIRCESARHVNRNIGIRYRNLLTRFDISNCTNDHTLGGFGVLNIRIRPTRMILGSMKSIRSLRCSCHVNSTQSSRESFSSRFRKVKAQTQDLKTLGIVIHTQFILCMKEGVRSNQSTSSPCRL